MRRIVGAIALAGVLLLSGCAAAPAPAAPPAAVLIAAATPATPRWSVPLDVIGRPVVTNGVIATYVRTAHGGLEVRAFRLTDGGELWRRIASVGHAAQGIELQLQLVRHGGRDLVAFLAPDPGWHPYELAVVGLATGDPVDLQQPAVVATDRPSACGDDVCFEGWALGTKHLREPARALRADLTTGRIAFDDEAALPKGGFSIGTDVFAAPDGKGSQVLGHTDHGKVTWTVPYARVFGKDAGTGAGRAWDRVEGLLIGSGAREGKESGGVTTIDLADARTAGLDPATRHVRWSLQHVGRCINDDEPLRVTAGIIELCRFSGTATTSRGSDELHYRDVRVERLGVVARTGAVQWRHRGVISDRPWTTVAGTAIGRWHPFQAGGRWVLLDRVTGNVRRLPTGSVLGCAGDRAPLAAPDPDDDGRAGSYSAGTFLRACGGGSALSRFAVTSGGTDGGLGGWVVAGEHTLSTYVFES